jgi:hypothetical protein
MQRVLVAEPELAEQMMAFTAAGSNQYQRRLKDEKAEAYVQRVELKVSFAATVLCKARCMTSRIFFLAAKSISAFRQSVPHRFWAGESKLGNFSEGWCP